MMELETSPSVHVMQATLFHFNRDLRTFPAARPENHCALGSSMAG
jgi:hypothetical protein